MAIYHYSSSHWEKSCIFTSDKDFVFGVNTLALACVLFNVRILCYCLMDNHIHILMEGSAKNCEECYQWILVRLAQMAGKRDNQNGRMSIKGSVPVAITSRKQFINEMVYILRNPYKARISAPSSYKWSSWGQYFNPWRDYLKGTPVSTLTQAQARNLFRTRYVMPSDYEHIDGKILNKCFVDSKAAEKIIGSSLDFFDTLRLWDLESAVKISHGAEESIKFTDAELKPKLLAICNNEYHVASIDQLDRKTLMTLARTASRRFGSGNAQLARLLGVSPEDLNSVL